MPEIQTFTRPEKGGAIDGGYHGAAYDALVRLTSRKSLENETERPARRQLIKIGEPCDEDLTRSDSDVVNATDSQAYYKWLAVKWNSTDMKYEEIPASSPDFGPDYKEEGYARALGGFCPIGAIVWATWTLDGDGYEELVFDAPQVWPAELGAATAVDGFTDMKWDYAWTEKKRILGGWDDVTGARTDASTGCKKARNGLEHWNPATIDTPGMTGAGVATPAEGTMLPLGAGTIVDMSATMLDDGTLEFQFYKPNTIGCP